MEVNETNKDWSNGLSNEIKIRPFDKHLAYVTCRKLRNCGQQGPE